MAIINSKLPFAYGFVLSEANGQRSRKNVTLITGQKLAAGTIVGRITASGKTTAVNLAANDGSQNAYGVLGYDVDATDGDKKTWVFQRDCELKAAGVIYPAGWNDAQKAAAVAQLADSGIVIRPTVP